jgi:hypothetical protein
MQEVIRRWQTGNNQMQIDVRTGLSGDTVHKYVAAAQGRALPGMGRRRRGAAEPASKGQPIEAAAVGYAGQDLLQMTRIHELLANRGCSVSYPSRPRFILKRNWRKLGTITVRMETPRRERWPRLISPAWA